MRQLREILRLRYEVGLAHRAIARACSVGLGTVARYLERAEESGITWPLPEGVDEAALDARLFRKPFAPNIVRRDPDFAWVHRELRRPGVTLQLLWHEYAEATPSQKLPNWVGSHIRMAEFFGGTTEIWVPDNLKSGITTPCRYEPEANRTYADLLEEMGEMSPREARLWKEGIYGLMVLWGLEPAEVLALNSIQPIQVEHGFRGRSNLLEGSGP